MKIPEVESATGKQTQERIKQWAPRDQFSKQMSKHCLEQL